MAVSCKVPATNNTTTTTPTTNTTTDSTTNTDDMLWRETDQKVYHTCRGLASADTTACYKCNK